MDNLFVFIVNHCISTTTSAGGGESYVLEPSELRKLVRPGELQLGAAGPYNKALSCSITPLA